MCLSEDKYILLPSLREGQGGGSAIMIKLQNIKKVFRTDVVETTALGGITLEVKDGELVAIMGTSGCGKSTPPNILGLLENPTEGEYWLDGKIV